MDLQSMFEKIMPKQAQSPRMIVRDARPILLQQETDALIDPEKINQAAVKLTEETGIVFIDELDKIASDEGSTRGPDVWRQGVQRDLLPIVEGTTVNTKYGPVKTDHVLFVAAGLPSLQALGPYARLQGRFPIRVEMHDLTRDDFARILRQPRASLVRQYEALLGTEGVKLEFTSDAIEAMADLAFLVNRTTQNIGLAACTRSSSAFSKPSASMPPTDRIRRSSLTRSSSVSVSRAFQRRRPEPLYPLTSTGPACCKVGLDRPLIPAAFVANLFRSARARRPCPNRRGLISPRPEHLGYAGSCGLIAQSRNGFDR